jgi:hypothetical protein
MYLFLIKKVFFDMWDNLLRVFVLNIAFLVLLLPMFGLAQWVAGGSAEADGGAGAALPSLVFQLAMAVLVSILFVYAGAVSMIVREMVDYESPSIASFVSGLKSTYRTSLFFAALNLVGWFVVGTGIRIYGSLNTMLGAGGQMVLVWVALAWLLIAQMFYPAQARLATKPVQILRKSALLFFDNTVFALLLFVGAVFIFLLSVPVAGMLLGFTTLLLWYHAAVKLRLYKYDYLEENPEANRRKIPWDALLIEERERVGSRTLRGMIFPWKE